MAEKPQILQNLAATAIQPPTPKSPYTEGTYARVMRQLCINSNEVPTAMPTEVPGVINMMAIAESETAQLINEANEKKPINGTMVTIQSNIKTLGSNTKNSSALQLQQMYQTQLGFTQPEALEKVDQRMKLNQEILEFAERRKTKAFVDVINEFKNKKPQAALEKILAPITTQLKSLKVRNANLHLGEVAVLSKLENLARQTKSAKDAISVSTGVLTADQIEQFKK